MKTNIVQRIMSESRNVYQMMFRLVRMDRMNKVAITGLKKALRYAYSRLKQLYIKSIMHIVQITVNIQLLSLLLFVLSFSISGSVQESFSSRYTHKYERQRMSIAPEYCGLIFGI